MQLIDYTLSSSQRMSQQRRDKLQASHSNLPVCLNLSVCLHTFAQSRFSDEELYEATNFMVPFAKQSREHVTVAGQGALQFLRLSDASACLLEGLLVSEACLLEAPLMPMIACLLEG